MEKGKREASPDAAQPSVKGPQLQVILFAFENKNNSLNPSRAGSV